MPEVVVEVHLDEDVAGQEDTVDGVLLAVAQLGDRLGWDHDAADLVLQAEGRDAALEGLTHLTLEAGVSVDDVPLEVFVDRRGKLLRGLSLRVLLFRILLFCRHGCAFFAHRLLLSTSLAGKTKSCCLVVLGQTVQQSFDCPADDIVHQPEVRGEDEDGDEDDHRRRLNFGARRGDHLAHFAAHVLEELGEASWLRLQLL